MTRPAPKELKIYLSATDWNTADIYLHEALEMYKNSFDGELQFIPRSSGQTGNYTSKRMQTFPNHLEDVIRNYHLKPYKSVFKPHIICCQTKFIPLCDRHPHINSGAALTQAKREANSMENDKDNRTIIIYPYRFQEREKKFRQKLLSWRKEPFKGKITIKPQGNYYSVNQKDLPQRIIKICRSVRIEAEISKENPSIIECDLSTLLPKKKKIKKQKGKTKASTQPQETEANTQPQEADTNAQQNQETEASQTQPAQRLKSFVEREMSALITTKNTRKTYSPSDIEIQALNRDVEIKFNNFPKVYTANNIAISDMKDDAAESTSLIMVVDLQNYPINTASDYAWDILEWADSYKFLIIHFLIGPPTRVPMNQEPKLRSMLINNIKMLASQNDICYAYEIAEKNHNLLICRHK